MTIDVAPPAKPLQRTPQHAPPLNERCFRLGKYLIPRSALRIQAPSEPAPNGYESLDELRKAHPAQLHVDEFAPPTTLSPYAYRVIDRGATSLAALPARSFPAEYVAQIEGGLLYGRHCTAVTPHGTVLRESGFFMDPAHIDSKSWFGRYGLRHYRYRRETDLTSRRRLPQRVRVAGVAAGINLRCSHNFYHWLIDILPRIVLARRSSAAPDYYLVDALSARQQSVLAALGIDARQIVQPHCQMLLQPDAALVPSFPGPASIRALGNDLLHGLGVCQARGGQRLFITRRKARTRRLQNEPQLMRLLAQRGFASHALEDYDLAEQSRLVREADVVVAVHGAGLANLLFARKGTHVIEIVPAGRYNATLYPELSRILGLRHTTVVASRARTRQILHVPLADIAAALVL